jgi:chemotaxis protein MotD
MKPISQPQPQSSAADRAPPAPFESLLDDSSQATTPPDPKPKPAASANTQRAARTEASKPADANKDTKPARAGDGKAGTAKADKPGKSAQRDKPDKSATSDATADDAQATNAKSDGDAKTDAKADTQAIAADMLTAAASGTPAAVTPVATALPTAPAVTVAATATATATMPIGPAQAIADDGAAAAAVGTAFAPAITATAASATKAVPAADAGKAGAKIDAKDKFDLAVQPDPDAPGADAKVLAKAVAPAQADGKPVDTDGKESAAPAGSEHANLDAQTAATAPQAAVAKASPDALQPLAMTAPAQHAPAPVSPAAAPTAQLTQQLGMQAVPLAGVAFEIAGKAVAGKNHFDIRLDPPELGRIEVRLDVSRDGSISSHVIADRKDTLDLLQRDASGLQRAFEDAGLKTSDQGMQFSLRDHSSGQQQHLPSAATAHLVVEDETSTETLPVTYSRLAGSGGGLDIRV